MDTSHEVVRPLLLLLSFCSLFLKTLVTLVAVLNELFATLLALNKFVILFLLQIEILLRYSNVERFVLIITLISRGG